MKRARAAVAKYLKSADLALLLLALILSLCGIVLIYSTTRGLTNANRYVYVQSAAIALGAVGYIVASLLDLRRFPRMWIVMAVLNVLFQLSLLFLGVAGDTGNRSWIPLGSTGLNVQPGEVGKIIFIYTMASHIQQIEGKLNSPLSFLQLVAHMGITTGAVFFASSDMGVALLYPLTFVIMLYASGASLWWFLPLGAGAGGMAPLLWKMMSTEQKNRILVVFDPSISPARAWHPQQSMAALSRGGLKGVGFLNGRYFVNIHNDFIFAALGEQFGFVGCAVLLLLFTLLVFRIFSGAFKSDDLFGKLICFGMGGMFMLQILINVGMCAGIMPVIGLTLPLVSYGGTSTAVTFAALGFVCGVRMRRRPQWLRTSGKQ